MSQEPQPAKKMVKRVVKKTVIKRSVTHQSAPEVRYGRKVAARPGRTAKSVPVAKVPEKDRASIAKPSISKPIIELGRKTGSAGKAVGRQSGSAAAAATGSIKRTAHTTSGFFAGCYRAARAWHVPRLGQTKAAAIVGASVGIVTALMATLLLALFSAARGVATGGGTWGSLTLVVMAFIAFALGEYLLVKFHVRQPRTTSFLSLCLTLVVIMALFIGPISGPWAWLILPGLGALTFAGSHRLIAMADSAPREV